MRFLPVVLTILVAFSAHAVEVTASGVGATEKRAIMDAKNNALEQVTGAFVVNKAVEIDGRQLDDRSTQYSGGVVRKFSVVSSNYTGTEYEVTIVADVDPTKDNNIIEPQEIDVVAQSAKMQEHADRYNNVERIAKALDSQSAAFAVLKPKVEYSPQGEYTDVRVTVGVAFQPKWIDDVRIMSKQSGQPIDVSTQMSDVLWGVGAVAAPFSMLGSSVIRSAAQMSTDRNPKTYTASNCFSKNSTVDVSECYAVGYMMGNVVRSDRFLVNVTMWSGNRKVHELPVAVLNNGTLFALHDVGTKLYFSGSAKERQFQSQGVVWFTDGIAIGTNTFRLNTQTLTNIDRMEYAIVR